MVEISIAKAKILIGKIRDRIKRILAASKEKRAAKKAAPKEKTIKVKVKPQDCPEHEYWRAHRFLYDKKMKMQHKGMRIKCDIIMGQTTYDGVPTATYDRRDLWTDESGDYLQSVGYKKVKGLYDTIQLSGVEIYLRILRGVKYDTSIRNENGQLICSQDTAATLHDVMTSTATADFIKGLGKLQMSGMDMQRMLMIGIVGVGMIFGLHLLGLF